MADEPKGPDAASAGAPRRKRTPATIDLPAIDVTPRAATTPETTSAAPPQEPPVGAPEPPPVAGTAEAAPPPESEAVDPSPVSAPPQTGPSSAPPPAAEPRAKIPMFVLIAAGTAGAAIVSLVMFAMWLTGTVPIRYPGTTAMRVRVAGLEVQMRELQHKATAGDPATLEALNGRIAKLESSAGTAPASNDTGERLAAAETAMKSIGVALAAINKRNDDIAANVASVRERADQADKSVTQLRGNVQDAAREASAAVAPAQVEALTQRLAALEQTIKALRDDVSKTATADKSARLAVSATALRAAVTSGAAYPNELAQAKALGANDAQLAALAPFASSGVPSEVALAQELRALLPAMTKAAGVGETQGSGFLDRLKDNASKLVRVQPVSAPSGDDAQAVLARIDQASARNDINAVLDNVNKLPEAARAPGRNWIAKVKARQAALMAARDLAAASARSLGSE